MTTFLEQYTLLRDEAVFQEKLSQFHPTLDPKTVLCVPALCIDHMSDIPKSADITTLKKWSIILIPTILLTLDSSNKNVYIRAVRTPGHQIGILDELTKTCTSAIQRIRFAVPSGEPFLYWIYITK